MATYQVNIEDPRSTDGPDGDMLDSACDPTPGADTNAGDHDNDGIMNGSDNCPLDANATQAEAELAEPPNLASPRGGSGTDAIGDVCDGPESICTSDADDDNDGLVNDGCPTVGGAAPETTCTFSMSVHTDNDFDSYPNDGCPQAGATAESGSNCQDLANDDSADDSLVNDGCPPEGGAELGCLNSFDDDADTLINGGCPSSSRVGNGHYHTALTLNPRCIGGTDADADGHCASATGSIPADPSDTNAARTPETYSQFRLFPVALSGSGSNPPASREPAQVCNDGIDNDGDTLVDIFDGVASSHVSFDDCRPPNTVFTTGPDADGDGSKDAVEFHVGTDPLTRCARGLETGIGPPTSGGWASDLRGDSTFNADKLNVGDLATFTSQGKIGKNPGQAGFDRRWDVRPGTNIGAWIGVSDIAAVSTLAPTPMYELRAFNLISLCSAHPVFGD
jgi:hypothetical protein